MTKGKTKVDTIIRRKADEFLDVFPEPEQTSEMHRDLALQAARLSVRIESFANEAEKSDRQIRDWTSAMNALNRVTRTLADEAARQAQKLKEREESYSLDQYLRERYAPAHTRSVKKSNVRAQLVPSVREELKQDLKEKE